MSAPVKPEEVMTSINRELPEGVRVVEAAEWPRKADAPANSILYATYEVPLKHKTEPALAPRLEEFLKQAEVITTRTKKKRVEQLNIRPWVHDLKLQEDTLVMEMNSGSPLFLAAYLLEDEIESVRTLGICKTTIRLKDSEIQVD
jgi:radical SAM-linked protein